MVSPLSPLSPLSLSLSLSLPLPLPLPLSLSLYARAPCVCVCVCVCVSSSLARALSHRLSILQGDAQVTAAEANMNFDMTAFYDNFVRSIADHNTDGAEFPHGEPMLQCNPLPLQPGADSLPYNCCASVESVALPQLAYGCSGWDFGAGKAGLLGSLPSVVPENSLAGGNQANNHPGIPPDGLHFLAWPG